MTVLNSPFVGGLIGGLATLVTGLIAIGVFRAQKRDEKVNASISILFEVRNAETNIANIKDKMNSNNLADLPSVLPSNNWKKYSHLFAKDFDEDELKLINSFYNSCSIIEDLARRQNDFLWIAVEERAKVAQRMLGKVHLEFQTAMANEGEATLNANKLKFDIKMSAVKRYFTDDGYFYAPNKTADSLRFHINNFQNLTVTTCGAKLKSLIS